MADYKYENFERWFNEPECWGLKSERFYYYVNESVIDQSKYDTIELWLQAAFDAGREQKVVVHKEVT